MVLLFLSVPLSKSSPRQGRYVRLVIAVLLDRRERVVAIHGHLCANGVVADCHAGRVRQRKRVLGMEHEVILVLTLTLTLQHVENHRRRPRQHE